MNLNKLKDKKLRFNIEKYLLGKIKYNILVKYKLEAIVNIKPHTNMKLIHRLISLVK